MRSTFVLWLVLSFLGVAVFGFLGMNMENGHGHANCLAAASASSFCPGENALASALFHISAYKNFSTALVVLALMLPLGLAAVFGHKSLFLFPNLNPASRRLSISFQPSSRRRQLLRWLAFHENSPSVSESAP